MSNGIGKISKKVLKSQVYTEFLYSMIVASKMRGENNI